MKNIFKEAHKMTREMVKKYNVDYQTQFGLCVSYLLENKEEKEMLKGSEKQVKWAEEIKRDMVECLENKIKATDSKFGKMEMDDKSRSNLNVGLNFFKEKLEEIKEEDKATWFIDNRNRVSKRTILKTGLGERTFKEIDLIDMYNISTNEILGKSIIIINTHTKEEYIQLF